MLEAMNEQLGMRVACAESTEKSRVERWMEVYADTTLTTEEKRARLREIDSEGAVGSKVLMNLKADLAFKEGSVKKYDALVRSLERFTDWEYEETTSYVLERNDHSRAHKLREATMDGMLFDGATGEFAAPSDGAALFSSSKVFVVRHDWAGAFEGSDMEGAEYRLPYEMCLFEFRVTGRTVVVVTWDQQQVEPHRGHTVFLEGADGVWLTFDKEAMESLSEFLWRQIRAICVALDAQVAEHSVVRAPASLNAKRTKNGKPPLCDFHVVDLSRRARAGARPDAGHTGRRVRMHFRRGHWRHYETHITWINWMLVGDPDLGFIDKHYRI